MEYEQITYERAKELFTNYNIPIYIGDVDSNNFYSADKRISDGSIDDVVKCFKNYYPDVEVKYYLHKTWERDLWRFINEQSMNLV